MVTQELGLSSGPHSSYHRKEDVELQAHLSEYYSAILSDSFDVRKNRIDIQVRHPGSLLLSH